jgi:hypothetical protein
VDDHVDRYTMGEADDVELVDLSYDSDNENAEMDEYDPEDNDVALLQSLQDKLTEEETGVIHVDDRSPYDHQRAYVDMTADVDAEEEEEVVPLPFQTPEQTPSSPIPSTPKRKDDGSMMSSASKRSKTTQDVPLRPYTPRKAKEAAAAKNVRKKNQRKAGKKRIRKVDEVYRSSEEEDTESEEE